MTQCQTCRGIGGFHKSWCRQYEPERDAFAAVDTSDGFRLDLRKLDSAGATYRTSGMDDPIHQYVVVQIDRDRFNALGKPGYLDVTYRPAPSLPADHTTTSEENRP